MSGLRVISVQQTDTPPALMLFVLASLAEDSQHVCKLASVWALSALLAFITRRCFSLPGPRWPSSRSSRDTLKLSTTVSYDERPSSNSRAGKAMYPQAPRRLAAQCSQPSSGFHPEQHTAAPMHGIRGAIHVAPVAVRTGGRRRSLRTRGGHRSQEARHAVGTAASGQTRARFSSTREMTQRRSSSTS